MSEIDPSPGQDSSGQKEATVGDPAFINQRTANETQEQALFTGACFCKALNFTLSSLPSKSYLCHCLDCRRITGTSFAHNMLFPFSSLNITTSATREDQKTLSTKPDVDSVLSTFGDVKSGRIQFCKICGSRLFLFPPGGAGEKVDFVVVTAGSIDGSHEDERLKPTDEGFCKRREAWMPDMRETKVLQEW